MRSDRLEIINRRRGQLEIHMDKNKKNEMIIHSSAAEYLTYVAAAGSDEQSLENAGNSC